MITSVVLACVSRILSVSLVSLPLVQKINTISAILYTYVLVVPTFRITAKLQLSERFLGSLDSRVFTQIQLTCCYADGTRRLEKGEGSILIANFQTK